MVAIGGDCRKECFWSGLNITVHEDFARLIHQANVHGLGMQVDSTVQLMLTFIESHHGPPWDGVFREPVKIGSRKWARNLGQEPPPREAMMSIKTLNRSRIRAAGSLRAATPTPGPVSSDVRGIGDAFDCP